MDGNVTWIHSDHLHSATILTDANGNEVRRLAYRAFGEELENSGSGEAPKYAYTGKERDASGLMYYGARYYDPVLSRFITADTVYDAGPQGLNRYAYALNNPIVYNDPSGHMSNPFALLFGWLQDSPVGVQVGNQMRAEAEGAAKGAVEGTALFATVMSISPDDAVVEAVQYAADKSGNKTLSKAVMIGGIVFSVDDVASPRAWKKWKKAKEAVKEIFKDSGDEVVEEVSKKALPVHKVSRSQYPNHTQMLENAQEQGHSLQNLKRGQGTRAAKKNRYQSQKEIRKQQGGPPDGYDYDEFPYASVEQGGAGAYVEPVPSAENQAAGRDLGTFYREQGVNYGDEYDVEITD